MVTNDHSAVYSCWGVLLHVRIMKVFVSPDGATQNLIKCKHHVYYTPVNKYRI